jgi:hypothetical protein
MSLHIQLETLTRNALRIGAVALSLAASVAYAAGPTIAFAHVRGDGSFDATNSKNVKLMGGANGLYCFKLAFTPRTVVATISEDPSAPNQGPGFIRAAVPPTPFFTCPTVPSPSSVVATFNNTQSTGGYAFYVYWTR